ncbi:cytochrome P450 [Xylariaceae sp. FL0255]|nr:cytochrome P450 [Xylariaceae sp. FL0255]
MASWRSFDTAHWSYDFASIIFALVSLFVIWNFYTTLRGWYRLRHFSGPAFASFSYLWGYFAMTTGHMHLRLAEEQDKYGKIVRIGPNELLVYDSQTLWQINNVRSNYKRGDWYSSIRIDPYAHNVLSEVDTAKHDERKAKLAAGYAGKGVVQLEAKIDSQIAILVGLVKKRSLAKGKSSIFDFSQIIRYFQVDMTTLAGCGQSWGDLVDETDHFEFISTADAFVPFLHCFMMLPVLRKFFASTFFLKLAGPKHTDKKGMGRLLGTVKDVVDSRFDDTPDGRKAQRGMIDEWISHGLTRRECELELAVQVPAGSETSTTAIRAILLHLLSSPQAYQKLRNEIDDGIRDGRISSPITNEEAKRLPYLQAVLNEGIRMVPPATTGFPKRVPAGGDTICGKFVPEGTDIFVNLWSMLRNKEVFGPDADVYRPERFLECDSERRSELLRNVDLAFGHGRWQCPGKTMAWLELNKIFVELLRVCDLQIAHPQSPWRCRGYSSFLIDDFLVRAIERV